MSERTPRLFKFPTEEVERWQKQADKQTDGNLTEWIRQRCNGDSSFERHVKRALEDIKSDLQFIRKVDLA